MPPREEAARERWTSVSELAEYAYCPRAWWYRRHPPPLDPDPAHDARVDRGERFHERRLGATRRREEWSGAIAWVAVGSLAVIALAVVGVVLGR